MTALAAIARATAAWPFRLWSFGEAIALDALLEAADRLRAPEWEQHVAALCLASIGNGLGSNPDHHPAPGRALVSLYRRRGDPRYLAAAEALAALHLRMPRNPRGALLVRAHQAGWKHQIWIDSVDLIGPLFAHLAEATGDPDRHATAIALTLAHLRCLQAESGLARHGFDTHAGPNGHFWSRGMGWALVGMADVLALAPPSTEGRAELRDRFAAMVAALLPLQRDDGLWPVVVDRPESYAEPTLPAMFAIALRRADPAVPGTGAAVAAAMQAVRALTDAEGVLGRVSEATPVGQYSTYATRPFGQFPWGQGPLLMMECTA